MGRATPSEVGVVWMGMDLEEGWFSGDMPGADSPLGDDLGVHDSFLQVMAGDDASSQMKEHIGAVSRRYC